MFQSPHKTEATEWCSAGKQNDANKEVRKVHGTNQSQQELFGSIVSFYFIAIGSG